MLWLWAMGCDGGNSPVDAVGTVPGDTGEAGLDADGDGWSPPEGDCDDLDPQRHPGAPESSGDGLDSNCDGWDALPLSEALGVTAQAQAPSYWLQFGHVLDAGDIDGDGETEIFAGSQHLDYAAVREGLAAWLDGPSLTQRAGWEGSSESNTARDFGRGVGILSADSGPQLVFLSVFGVWVVSPDASSGDPEQAGGIFLQSDGEGYYAGLRLTAVDVLGSPDEDVVLECSTATATQGHVCVLEGPITAPDTLSGSDLILSGGPGLGSGLAGADVDGDGRGDLILGASNAQDDKGEIVVLPGPLPAGQLDTVDASYSWVGENEGDWLGQVVSRGDLDGDGLPEVIGSAMAWPSGDRNGRVYGLPLDTTEVPQAGFVIDGDGLQHLGMGLASGDVNGDGQDDLAVGAPSIPVDFSVPGLVLVYFGPLSGMRTTGDADIAYIGEAAGDGAGVALAIGDVDGSGIADLIVSAPYHDEAETDSGKIYLLPGPLVP
jgi:hypothetical protein